MEFEVKTWLDMDSKSSKAKIAKELIALENHGGGYLIIGFDDKSMLPDEENRPAHLDEYSVDRINSIIAKFAEPKFHVNTTIQKDSIWRGYPFIQVYWNTQVPVRSCSEDTEKNIIENKYYIRRPWPISDIPKDWLEWDQFIKKCVLKQRREIADVITSFINQWWEWILHRHFRFEGDTWVEIDRLDTYVKQSLNKWKIENSKLEDSSKTKNKYWYYYFSSRIIWTIKNKVHMKFLLDKIRNFRKYTWWPIFLIIRKQPEFIDDSIELSLLDQWFESDHSDFWRVWKDGINFVLRGYQEDCRDDYKPWEVFDLTIPIWRLWEYLLHILDLGNSLYEEGFQVIFEWEWNGLQNRTLVSLEEMRFIPWNYVCQDNIYKFRISIWDKEIQDILPLVLQKILSWLYEKFNLFEASYELYEEQAHQMVT